MFDYEFSPTGIAAALNAVVAASLAVLTFARRFSRSSLSLFGLSMALAAYQVARAVVDVASDPAAAVMWARIGCAAALLISAAAYQFAVTTFESSRRHRVMAVINWLIAAQLAGLTLTTGYLTIGVQRFWRGFVPAFTTAALFVYPLFLTAALAATITVVARQDATGGSREASRRRLFLIALGIGSIAMVDLLPVYGIAVYPFGWAALLAATAVVVFAVTKYGLPAGGHLALPAAEIISTMRDLLLVSDGHGNIRFANNAACTFLGYGKEDIVGRRLEDLLAPAADGESLPLRGWVRDREYIFRTKLGQPIELTLSYSPITSRRGEVTGAVIIGRDLRDRKRYEWEARRAVALLQSTLDSTADGILVIAQDGRVLTWNQRFAEMWAVPAEVIENERADVIGQVIQQLADPGAFLESLAALNEHPDEERMQVLQLKDGRRFEQYSIGRYLDDQPVRVWSFRDVTARLDAEDQIHFQAYHDALTHLPNRRLFVERLELSLLSAKRVRSCLAVLFMDLDRFKEINDTLGHDVADGLLVEIGERLRNCVRQTDTVARHGGDEFTIMLPELRQAEDATQVAEKILERVSSPVVIGSASMEVTASIGIAVYPHDGADIETLLRNADDAMYRAKQAGRNNYQVCTQQIKEHALERSSVQSRLRKALDEDELALTYEPQISLRTGRVVGAEAIIHWKDPERGIIEARDFIPLAEETPLIVVLGEWALFRVCRQVRCWIDGGLSLSHVGVNVSLRQFQQRDLASIVRRAVEAAGIDPMLLELEIGETTATRDLALSADLLKPLRDLGVSLAIDDFGAAYSSLRALRGLPIQAVKLDRNLTAGAVASQADESVAAAVLNVAQHLNLRVCADGVETREQFEFLRDHSCHEGQGPYFGAPVDADAFAALTLPPPSPPDPRQHAR